MMNGWWMGGVFTVLSTQSSEDRVGGFKKPLGVMC